MTATSSFENVRSRLCGNVITACYTNFFTAGFLDGLDIFDNLCSDVVAINEDTTGPANTRPHSAAGGSFDAGGPLTTTNISMMGNILNAGHLRKTIHEELGLFNPTLAATGAKFNDPQAPDSYANVVCAFNLIVTRGVGLEHSGFDGVDTFNNTLASSPDQEGGAAVMTMNDVLDGRIWNNVLPAGIVIKTDDSRTLGSIQGYANHRTAPYSEYQYYRGHPTKGFGNATDGYLSIDEVADAYTPGPDSVLLSGHQPQGALGTGLYQGNGVHTAVYDYPVSAANDPAPTVGTILDGVAYADWTGNFGEFFATNTDEAFIAMHVKRISSATSQCIMHSQGGRMLIELFSNRLQVVFKAGDTTRVTISSNLTIPDDGAYHLLTLGIKGPRVVLTLDGVVEVPPIEQISTSGNFSWRGNVVTLFATYFSSRGDRPNIGLRALWIDNVFHDMLDEAEYAAIHNADGTPRPWGDDGTGWFAQRPTIFLRGDATDFRVNRGTGPNLSWRNAGGLLTDLG